MTRDEFRAYAKRISDEGGSIRLDAVLRHIVEEHNNVSWVATLDDLRAVVEEMTGCTPIERIP